MKKRLGKNKLKGIRGWLMFYVIILVLYIVSSLVNIIYTLTNYRLYLLIGNSISFILFVVSLIFILKESKKAIMINIIALWVAYLVGVGFSVHNFLTNPFVPSSLPQGYDDLIISANIFGIVFSSLLGLVAAILWTFYWRRSERVKNTFVH